MKEVRILKNLEDTFHFAREISLNLTTPTLIGLKGEMGSGKTHFVKFLAEVLNMKGENANSPTYAIHQQYINEEGTLILHHVDLFRLETEDEIESSGFWDLFYDLNCYIAVEWIDRIEPRLLPKNFKKLILEWTILPNGEREVKYFVIGQPE